MKPILNIYGEAVDSSSPFLTKSMPAQALDNLTRQVAQSNNYQKQRLIPKIAAAYKKATSKKPT